MISGKPVRSSTERTCRPADASSRAVPPVETSSTPSSARPRANSTMPRLSETESSARRTRTSPGSTVEPRSSAPCALSVLAEMERGYLRGLAAAAEGELREASASRAQHAALDQRVDARERLRGRQVREGAIELELAV